MKTKPLNTLQVYFKESYITAKKESKQITEQLINDLHIKHEITETQILKLNAKLSSLYEEYEESDFKEYVLYSSLETQILNLFISRFLLQDKNDIDKIKEAIILSEKINTIKNLLEKKQTELPAYKFKDLLNNKSNVFFTEFTNCPPNTTASEYYKMREAQFLAILDTINVELRYFKNTFIKNKHSNEDISKEIINCRNRNLKNVIALKNSTGPTESSLKNESSFKEIELFTCKTIINNYKKQTAPHISCPQIFNVSLRKYTNWLEYPSEIYNYNFNKIFNQEYKAQLSKYKRISFELKKRKLSIEQIKNRIKTINLTHQKVNCHIIPNLPNNRHHLKSLFFWHLLFSDDIMQSIALLNLSINISLYSDFYMNELLNHDKNIYNFSQILNNLEYIGADANTYNECISVFRKQLEFSISASKTIFSIYETIIQKSNELSKVATLKLMDEYESIDAEKSTAHATMEAQKYNNLKDLLSINDIEMNPQIAKLGPIFIHRIEYYSRQAFLSKLKINIPNIEIALLDSSPVEKTFSFQYNKSEIYFIQNIVKALNSEIDLLNIHTSERTLIEILSLKDLSKETRVIHLACKTNEFKFIIECIQPLFKNLSFSSIGKSKLFISKRGKVITTSNLTSAETDNVFLKSIIKRTICKHL